MAAWGACTKPPGNVRRHEPRNEHLHDRASHADVEDANPVPTGRPQELRQTKACVPGPVVVAVTCWLEVKSRAFIVEFLKLAAREIEAAASTA